MTPRVHQRVRERDLKIDLLAAGCGCSRQGSNLRKGAPKLLRRFNQSRALQRPLSRFAPQASGVFN